MRSVIALLLLLAQSGCAHLNVVQRAEHVDLLAREPMLLELPDGKLFVTGYGGTRQAPLLQSVPRLWQSIDGGITWQAVNVGAEADGAVGNSDVDLARAPDGTLYFVSMGFDRPTREGTHIAVAVSRDAGQSWRWRMLTQKRRVDRPWIEVAPDGVAHAIWNDGTGVYHAMSSDRGESWSEPQRIYPRGGSSHFAIGPHGELAVRVAPLSASGGQFDPGVDLLVVSTDAGRSWQPRELPGTRDWTQDFSGTPRWVEPIAWDASGALYLLWTESTGVWLARSKDQGATWQRFQVDTGAPTYFPYLVARERGELAATWFSGVGDTMRWRACRMRLDDDELNVVSADPQIADILEPGESSMLGPGTGGEYLPVIFLREGGIGVAVPIQNPTTGRFGFAFVRFR